jgi:hypothetical protein
MALVLCRHPPRPECAHQHLSAWGDMQSMRTTADYNDLKFGSHVAFEPPTAVVTRCTNALYKAYVPTFWFTQAITREKHPQCPQVPHKIAKMASTCCNSGGSALFGQPGAGGANHRGGSQLMRFTRLDPGGQCHCCLAKMSM